MKAKTIHSMKNNYLFLVTVLLMLSTDLYASHAEAVFSALDRNYIQISLNGKLVNDIPSRQVFVQDRPGRHGVEIKVFNQWGRLQYVHQDRILVNPNSRHNFILQVNPYGHARLVQQRISIKPAMAPKAPKPLRSHRPLVADLSSQEFRILHQNLLYQQTDRQRMAVAKKSLHHRQLYAEDVKELLYLFDFESSRLSFARFAFRRVIDPQHYSSVYEAFQYQSTLFKLEDYIARSY
jgi:hypothetical protein